MVLCIAVLLGLFTRTEAQADTTGLRLHSLRPVPLASGALLGTAGGLMTFQPEANQLEVRLRNEVVGANLQRVYFDDYVQYLPAVAPMALNLCGLHSRHSLSRMAMLEGGSYLLGLGWLYTMKYGFAVQRPDGAAFNSFPSGHTFISFTGAEILRREYGEEYPWIAVAGYTVAIVVGAMRVWNNRHWAGDVLAGAGLGIMSVTLAYWALD